MINNKSYLLIFAFVLASLISCKETDTTFPIIPQANNISFGSGHFVLSKDVVVYTNLGNIEKASFWLDDLHLSKIVSTQEVKPRQASINLFIENNPDSLIGDESYKLIVSECKITITSQSEVGLFYGIQTLIQLKNEYDTQIPTITIDESPRFAVRSLMLDASSFYLSPTFIKKQIDAMAYYKLNRLQLLLGGEGGWRIPIQDYTILTEKTAWRTTNNFQQMKILGGSFCSKDTDNAFGGYYTHKEIKDLINYASLRNITILPAIDLPDAHFELVNHTGLSTTTEDQIHFVKSALTSIIELFPSEYIYIGNGKADDSFGTTCESCRQKVDKTDIFDSSEPYYSVLQEASTFLKTKGRKLITWEESLRMNLQEDPTIITWRDKADGINSAKRNHKTILAPANISSLNFYQSDPTQSPKAMSGFLPIENIYEFNISTPDSLLNFIDGVQINMWTHNIDSESDIEYQLYPRLLAFAEVGWTNPNQKSFLNFKKRILKANKTLAKKSYSYFDISKESPRRKEQDEAVHSLAKYKPVEYKNMFSSEFPAKGVGSLTDGIRGGWHYSDKNWQGFAGEKMSIIIDLEEETTIKVISADFIKDEAEDVYLPQKINIYVSNDGNNYELLDSIESKAKTSSTYSIENYRWDGKTSARYIKYEVLKNPKQVSWLFTDEIIIQ